MTIDLFCGSVTKKNGDIAFNAFQYLKSQNLIYPGSIISGVDIEQALGIKADKDDWKFLGPFRALLLKLEEEAFFVVQKKIKFPGIKLLHSNEMPMHAFKKLARNFISTQKVNYIMDQHKCEEMNESDQKRFDYMKEKVAKICNHQNKIYLENSTF